MVRQSAYRRSVRSRLIEVHLQQVEQLLATDGRVRQVPKGEHVFFQGDRDARLHFVRAGHLKAYYTGIDGREQVKSLVGPGASIGSLAAMEPGGSCTFSLVAIRDATIISLPFDLLVRQAETDIGFANEVIAFLIAFARRKEKREHDLLCLTAEERYRGFLAGNPADAAAVPQADIAAHIGITPQALSRIKRRIAQQDRTARGDASGGE